VRIVLVLAILCFVVRIFLYESTEWLITDESDCVHVIKESAKHTLVVCPGTKFLLTGLLLALRQSVNVISYSVIYSFEVRDVTLKSHVEFTANGHTGTFSCVLELP
jgi:hypothetical protein